MSFYDQIDRAKKVRDVMVNEAPRDNVGALTAPFAEWVRRLDEDIMKAEKWHRDTEAGKVHTDPGPDPTR